MKKISLLLAMLLCLAPLFVACGANSSPEKAVVAALDVLYGDGDAEAEDYWAVAYNYNLELIELMDSEEASDYKEMIRAAQKEKKSSFNSLEDMDETAEDAEFDDWDFEYEILYCNTYEKGSDTFDAAIEDFEYVDTDVEDYVEEVATVGVLVTRIFEKDDETFTSASVQTYSCYKIDGDWYIEG